MGKSDHFDASIRLIGQLFSNLVGEDQTPLTFPFQSVSALAEHISNLAKYWGGKVELRTEISDT